MAKVLLDLNEVNLDGFEPVPAGTYIAWIDASDDEVREGAEKGTPYITLYFVIESPEEYANRRVRENYMLSGKGAFRLPRLMQTLGLLEDVPEDRRVAFDTRDLHGKRVRIRVSVEPDREGNPRNTVRAVMRVEDSAKQPGRPGVPANAAAGNKRRISF